MALPVLVLLAPGLAQSPPPIKTVPAISSDTRVAAAVERLSQAAELFFSSAQQYICRERLDQKVLQPASADHIAPAKSAAGAPGDANDSYRAIDSYFAFTTVAPSAAVREIREMLKVDKKTLAEDEAGRASLRNILLGGDSAAKKKLRDRFTSEAPSGIVTDLSQMILLFDRAGVRNFNFSYARNAKLGGAPAIVIRYEQRGGNEGVHIEENGKRSKSALEGTIWVTTTEERRPLRITMTTSRRNRKREIRDEAQVDYHWLPSGALLPAMVIYRRFDNSVLAAEDDFRYSQWESLK